MARHGLPRTFLLPLVCITTLFHFELVKADVRVPCGMVKDWFSSGTKPQSSQPPYMLNVTDPDGNMDEPYYASRQKPYTISLNGTRSGDITQNFTGFMLYAYNEFDDEDSGDFLPPLPAGVSKRACHFKGTAQYIEVLENSTNSMQWNSIQIKWKSPEKSISGKITFSASVVKEDGVFWDGPSVTLNHMCPMPSCNLPKGCPNGLARNKYGCINCECAGASSVTVGFLSLVVIIFSAVNNLV